jgi:ATP-binding cassette subfamily F protein 3
VIVQLHGVSKSFGSRHVLRDVAFQINPTEKVGLIGSNGAGKTTLLRIIAAVTEPDSGSVSRKSALRIGTLEQIPDFHDRTSVLEEALRSSDDLRRLESELRELEQAIAAQPQTEVLDRYSQLQHEFELKGGYTYRARTEAALLGVGFSRETFGRPSSHLSGGEKNRLALAKLLLSNAELLLLDEPTNHLDIRSVEWLEKFLKDTDKTVVVVSHDRVFLDRVVARIIEIDDGRIQDYRGNYSDYLKQRSARVSRQEKQWRLQQEWIEKQEDYIRRNIAGQKTKQAQSRRRLLARVQPIERPLSAPGHVHFRFVPAARSGRHVLTARHLAIGFDEKPLISALDLEVQRGERWAILGPNGAGKTTLLKTLIGQRSPIAGELDWNAALDVGYYDQQLQDLESQATVLDEIRKLDPTATDGTLRAYLAQFLFCGDDVFKKIAQLSGGEKSRLTLARIIYAAPQLLALDEPTNHLDIASREALESALAVYPGTILFVSHDRYLVEKIATHLLYMENGHAHTFDRLSVFEQWLNQPDPARPPQASVDIVARDAPRRPALSKNRRDQLEKEAAELESQIASVEASISELEQCFQNPPGGTDWQSMHRRYAELKSALDQLYAELAGRWEIIG